MTRDCSADGGGSWDGAREQVVLAHRVSRSGCPLAGNTDATIRPEAEPRPCGVPAPSQGDASRSASMATSRASSEIEGFGPRRFPGGRSAVACCRDFMASQRGTGNHDPRPNRPAGGRRPNPCRERWRHSSPRPPPPQRAGRLRLGLASSSTCMINSPIRFGGDVQFRHLHADRPCVRLEQRHRSRRSPSRCHCSSRKISTPNCRDKSSTGSPCKSRRATSRLRVTVHRWPSPSGSLPAKPLARPENADDCQARPRLPQAHQQQLSRTSKLSVMFRSSLDTSIKPILCPRKSASPTHIFAAPPEVLVPRMQRALHRFPAALEIGAEQILEVFDFQWRRTRAYLRRPDVCSSHPVKYPTAPIRNARVIDSQPCCNDGPLASLANTSSGIPSIVRRGREAAAAQSCGAHADPLH